MDSLQKRSTEWPNDVSEKQTIERVLRAHRQHVYNREASGDHRLALTYTHSTCRSVALQPRDPVMRYQKQTGEVTYKVHRNALST